MGRKKPKAGRICISSTFAGVDVHTKLIEKNVVQKSHFTDGYTYWYAIPMYDITNDEKYDVERDALRKMCVPVDYESEDKTCVVYDWQIKKVL